MSSSVLASFRTSLDACALEVFPRAPLERQRLLCGCYQLREGSQDRDGELLVLDVSSGVELVQSVTFSSGVTDAKFSPVGDFVAVSKSTGSTAVYAATESEESPLRFHGESTLGDECLYLSLDWARPEEAICVSKSNGEAAVFAGELQCIHNWTAHTHMGIPAEVWIVACSREDPLLLTGADDSVMKLWDLRCLPTPTAVVRDMHDAGVTAAQWHPTENNIFCSGSYDERVRVWDVRTLKAPLQVVQTPGGVWRVKWHPCGGMVLVANMYGGVCVVDPSDGGRISTKFKKHESMAYGIDWCPRLSTDSVLAIASCSFYDKALYIWHTQIT